MSLVREDGAELLAYDDIDFPVFCRHNWIPAGYPLGKYTPMHWHDEVELIYIEKGLIHHRINGDFITLKKGDGLFINSKQFHELVSDEQSDCILYCLIFNPILLVNCMRMEEIVNNIASNENLEYIALNGKTKWKQEILDYIKNICDDNVLEDREMEMNSLLYKLWEVIYKNCKTDKKEKDRINYGQRIVKEMVLFIQNNYSNTLTLNDICKAGNVGKTKCTELFKKYLHMTPLEYVKCIRLEKAIELLENTDMTISEIAYEVGFMGASYFTESFKKTTGKTPLGFRRELEDLKKGY